MFKWFPARIVKNSKLHVDYRKKMLPFMSSLEICRWFRYFSTFYRYWDLCLIDHENAFDIKSFILIGLIKILFIDGQIHNALTQPHPMIEIRSSWLITDYNLDAPSFLFQNSLCGVLCKRKCNKALNAQFVLIIAKLMVLTQTSWKMENSMLMTEYRCFFLF